LNIEVPDVGWQRDFALDPMTQERLLQGWDDIGLSLRREGDIARYESMSTAPSLAGVFDHEGHTR
jgi:3-isopropylmalate dehydratase small subunit